MSHIVNDLYYKPLVKIFALLPTFTDHLGPLATPSTQLDCSTTKYILEDKIASLVKGSEYFFGTIFENGETGFREMLVSSIRFLVSVNNLLTDEI
jgi:hypothetical protein